MASSIHQYPSHAGPHTPKGLGSNYTYISHNRISQPCSFRFKLTIFYKNTHSISLHLPNVGCNFCTIFLPSCTFFVSYVNRLWNVSIVFSMCQSLCQLCLKVPSGLVCKFVERTWVSLWSSCTQMNAFPILSLQSRWVVGVVGAVSRGLSLASEHTHVSHSACQPVPDEECRTHGTVLAAKVTLNQPQFLLEQITTTLFDVCSTSRTQHALSTQFSQNRQTHECRVGAVGLTEE